MSIFRRRRPAQPQSSSTSSTGPASSPRPAFDPAPYSVALYITGPASSGSSSPSCSSTSSSSFPASCDTGGGI